MWRIEMYLRTPQETQYQQYSSVLSTYSEMYSISHDNTCQYTMNTLNTMYLTMYLDILARQWSRDGVCLPQLLLGPGYIPQGVLGVVLGAAKATHR